MILGEVLGAVVAVQRAQGLEGKTFLLVQPLESDGSPVGDAVVAVDTVMAGPGDRVFMVLSREAALALDPWFVPVDHAIVGIVDSVDVTPEG
ncbi:MAG: EutN/CcmL family microcompartment protein [Deltaproteobacteria bacterium]|nr:EutN/CcmL family microcompartment protein [Deltaproteobacteria bacterium]